MKGIDRIQPGFRPLGIRGASLERGERHYALRLDSAYRFLSSAPLGGGVLESRWVLSLEVTPDAWIPCPETYLRDRAAGFGIPADGPFIGLLTAVRHGDLQVRVCSEGGVTAAVLVTAGVSNASGPRQKDVVSQGCAPAPGTINVVALLDADLSPGALARASTMIAEAKTLALMEAGVRTANGSPATGTSTDASAVGCSGRGVHFDYAGSPTLAGWLAAATAHEAVSRGIAAYKIRKDRERVS